MFLMTTSFASNPVHRDVASGGGAVVGGVTTS